jgi:hypothetical protein
MVGVVIVALGDKKSGSSARLEESPTAKIWCLV